MLGQDPSPRGSRMGEWVRWGQETPLRDWGQTLCSPRPTPGAGTGTGARSLPPRPTGEGTMDGSGGNCGAGDRTAVPFPSGDGIRGARTGHPPQIMETGAGSGQEPPSLGVGLGVMLGQDHPSPRMEEWVGWGQDPPTPGLGPWMGSGLGPGLDPGGLGPVTPSIPNVPPSSAGSEPVPRELSPQRVVPQLGGVLVTSLLHARVPWDCPLSLTQGME